jgi:hypothetical protein
MEDQFPESHNCCSRKNIKFAHHLRVRAHQPGGSDVGLRRRGRDSGHVGLVVGLEMSEKKKSLDFKEDSSKSKQLNAWLN